MALAERAVLVAELKLDDKLSGGVNRAGQNLRRFDGVANRTRTGLRNLGGAFLTIGKVAAVSMAGVVAVGIKAAGDFEAALHTINTVAGATPEQLGKIGDSIRKIARDTGTELSDLTAGYYDLVSAGISAADAQGVLAASNTLAIGGLSTTAEAIDLLTTAINSYGLSASQATNIADYFAQAIAAGKVTAAELGQSFSQVASIAASSGIEIQELAAGYAQLTAKGVPAAEAATQMRSAIVALTKLTAPLEKLQKKTGQNYLAIAGKKGLATALEIMRKDAEKAGIPLIDLLGRVEGLNYTLGVTGPNFDAYNKALNAVEHSSGTAARQMAERQQGLNFQLARLRANAKDAAITIGSELLPKLMPLAEKLNDFLGKDSTRKAIGDFGSMLAGSFETIAGWVGRIPWEQVSQALQVAGAGARAIADVFLSLPPWVQTAVLTGWGLNKLSGGALKGIIGDLGVSLFKRGGTPANPLFVADVTGGLGKGGVLGGGKGIVGGLLNPVTIGAAVIAGLSVATWEGVVMPQMQAAADANTEATQRLLRTGTLADLQSALAGLENMPGQLDPLKKTLYDLNVAGVKVHAETLEQAIRDEIANRKASAKVDAIAAADLKERAAILKRAIDSGHTRAGGEEVLKTQARNVIRRRDPIRTGARAIEAREAGMTAEEQAVFRRALAAGRNPTDAAIQKTIEKNTAAAVEESRKTTLALAIAERVRSLQQAFANMQLAKIAGMDFAPRITIPVYVTSTTSVRNTQVEQRVMVSYNTGKRTFGGKG